jgi:predicted Ser/Thr protein kinase
MTTHKSENLVGRTFEKCKLVAKLGAGGMGSVYLAEHEGLKRKVALKILPADMSRDPEYVARFRREALTAARLEHPNIVQVYDVGQHDGRPYIVMQYVDGESLSTVVENLGAMEPKDAAKVIAGMLRGLHHAHEAGIVHRDVKPDNVLVTKGDQPKLLDFGLATESEGSLQITKDGMVVGTPYYLSPEQARGKKASPASDIYAAGVTLYYLLTGTRPFNGATALAVLNKQIHEQPVPPIKHNPKIPRVLNDVVLKLMSKHPEDRYPSAAAAAQALEDWLAGRQVRVVLPWRARLPALTRKQRLGIAAGGGAVGALLLTLLIAALVGGDPEPAPPPPPDTKSSGKAPPPPPPVDPAKDKDLLDLLTFAKSNQDDQSAWSLVLDRFDVFLGLTKSKEILDYATKGREDFVAHIRRKADAELARIRRADADPLVQLHALETFPKAMLSLDVLADLRQTLREDRERLLERLDLRFLEDEAALDRLLAAEKFAEAQDLVRRMLRIVEVLPYARERRLPRIQRVRDEEIPRRERDAADRLVKAWEPVQAALERDLTQRKTDAAWAHAVKFLKEHKEPELRAPGVNYDMLMSLVPDPQLSEARLGNALVQFAGTWPLAEDELRYRILADLQDVLDLQWLTRQVTAGLRKLAASAAEIRLETFKSAGRVTLGRTGLEFSLKAGGTRSLNTIADLRPLDLLLFAAAAEGLTPDAALDGNASLVRATGVAWLYSPATEKWAQAEILLTQAQEKRAPVAAFRRDRLRHLGRAQAREALTGALKLAASGKFDDAQKQLLELATAWAHDADIRVEIGRALAVAAGAEMRRAAAARDHLRVKSLARKIFELDPQQYAQPGFVQMFGHAVRNTQDWQSLPPDPQDAAWTWEGREQKAAAPAVERRATGEGMLLQPGPGLWMSKARARGVSGFNAQLRVHGRSAAFEASLHFDGEDGRRRRIVFRDPDELLLMAGDANGERILHQAKLDARLTQGRWFDLGWAVDGGTLVVYFDQRPVFAVRSGVRADGAFGVSATQPVNVRTPQFRR